jgi:hypothetical protein
MQVIGYGIAPMPNETSTSQMPELSWFDTQSQRDLFNEMKFGCVYALGPDLSFPIRIGWAKDPFRKMEKLQPGSWEKLKIKHAIWVGSEGLAKRIQAEVDRSLGAGGYRLFEEWFDLTRVQAAEAIEASAVRINIPYVRHDQFVREIKNMQDHRVRSQMAAPVRTFPQALG